MNLNNYESLIVSIVSVQQVNITAGVNKQGYQLADNVITQYNWSETLAEFYFLLSKNWDLFNRNKWA